MNGRATGRANSDIIMRQERQAENNICAKAGSNKSTRLMSLDFRGNSNTQNSGRA